MSQTASGSLMLTGPHQILSVEVSSSTIRLSLGDRPVFAPEEVAMAPALVIADPVSLILAFLVRPTTPHTKREHPHIMLVPKGCR